MAFTFTKQERLCSNILITKLFEKGNPKVNGFPFRISWVFQPLDNPTPAQVIFLVSKRKFGRANQRNRIKRQMRELYRLRKHLLYNVLTAKNKQIILSVSYIGDAILPTAELTPIFDQTFQKMLYELEKRG